MKYFLIAFFGAVLSSLAYWIISNVPYNNDEYLKLPDVTSSIAHIFKNLDLDSNGVLNVSEFLALSSNYILLQRIYSDPESKCTIHDFPDLPVKIKEQIIQVVVEFQPLNLNSLRKNISDLPKEDIGSLQSLLNWKSPYKNDHGFGAKYFSAFIPSDINIQPGHPWWIIEFKSNKYFGPLSSRRYHPPCVDNKVLFIHALLSLFHPRPFLWTRFAPQGIAAVVRAVEEDYFDIVFRIHAEYQLSLPPDHPFWFTPSQFVGQLIINKYGTVVKHFYMEVPPTTLNVDMEWYNGLTEDSMEVDIGHIPQMSLKSSAISVPLSNEKGAKKELNEIKWTKEISFEEAISILELQFYSFKKVKYYDMVEAFDIANTESKLVHGLVLWGNLDDQSC